MKRLTAILLCICICALLIPPFALADEGEPVMPDVTQDTAEETEISAEETDEKTLTAGEAEPEEPENTEEEIPEEAETPSEKEDTQLPSEQEAAEPAEESEGQEETDEEELVIEDASLSGETEKLHIILIGGQSNAAMGSGMFDASAVTALPGEAYVWNIYTGQLEDLYNYDLVYAQNNPGSSIGFFPAIAAEWYSLTGEKAVIIPAGYSGASIDLWRDRGFTSLDVQAIYDCAAAISGSDNKELVGGGYYWLQGESDSSLTDFANLGYKNTREYEECFINYVHNPYMTAFRNIGVSSPYCGILTCRSWGSIGTGTVSEYCGVRAAQQHLANSHSEIYMASVLTDTWLRNGASQCVYNAYSGNYQASVSSAAVLSSDMLHYRQSAYNVLGLEAADSIYRATRENVAASSFTVFGHNAVKTYESGDTIYIENNIRAVGPANNYEDNAAQIVIFPTPSYGFCSSGRMSVKLTRNSDGSVVPLGEVMDESGYIYNKYNCDEDMTLTVSVGGVTKTFTLARKSYDGKPETEVFYENIPDVNFARAIKDKCGPNMTVAKAAAVTSLDVSGYGIADLSGIELFTGLQNLDCSDNSLLSLDVSSNRLLTSLDCSNNLLSTLNMGGEGSQIALSAAGNRFAYFDVTGQRVSTYEFCSQTVSGLQAYKAASGRYVLDLQALVGSGRIENVGEMQSYLCFPNGSNPKLIITDVLPKTVSYSYALPAGTMSVTAETELSDTPPVRPLQDYMIIPAGQTRTLGIDTVSDTFAGNVTVAWSCLSKEDGAELSINGSDMTAVNSGTAVLAAAVTLGTDKLAEFEVRADITPYDITHPETGVTGVSLAGSAVNVELFSTYYTEVEILPELAQLSLSDGYGVKPENTGVAIKSAEFVNSKAANLFELIPYGDRTLRIVPTDTAIDYPSSVAGTYKSAINVVFEGNTETETFTTDMLTVTVKKNLPKIKAANVNINSWAGCLDNSAVLSFSGGTVTDVETYPSGGRQLPDWLRLDAQKQTLVYSGLEGARKRDQVYMLCTVEGYERVPVAVSFKVTAAPTVPSIKFSPASVTLAAGTYDCARIKWTYPVKEYEDTGKYPVSVTYILEGNNYKGLSYKNGEVLSAEVDNNSRTVTVRNARNDGRNHTYKVFLYCAGKEFSFQVKTVSKAVGLKFKASGAINTNVANSPVMLTPTFTNFNREAAAEAEFSLDSVTSAAGGYYTSQFKLSGYSGGSLKLTAKPGEAIPTGSYNATVSMHYSGIGTATSTVRFNVKNSSAAASVNAKISGYIDTFRSCTYATVRPEWKNCYTHSISENDIVVCSKVGTQYYDITGLFDVRVSEDGETYHIGAAENLPALKYYVRIETAEATSAYRALTVKSGKVSVTPDVKSVNLFLNDRYNEKVITLKLNDSTLNKISDVQLDSASARFFRLEEYSGNGRCVIGWKDNMPAGLRAGVTKTLKLSIYLEGSDRIAATVNVKVTAR